VEQKQNANICSGMEHNETYTLADIYIHTADKCKTKEELFRLYKELQLDFTERIQEIRKQPVISLPIKKCIFLPPPCTNTNIRHFVYED